MKKINAGLLILCLCFSISCTKAPVNPGSWTFQGATITAAVAARTNNPGIALSAVSTDGYYSVLFFFHSYPTASGMYTVVNSTTPAAGQVGVQAGMGNDHDPMELYTPTGSTSPQATVTVSGGRVSISVPSLMLANQGSYYYSPDTTAFAATIHQSQ